MNVCVCHNITSQEALTKCGEFLKGTTRTKFILVLKFSTESWLVSCQQSKNSILYTESEIFLGVCLDWKGDAFAIMHYIYSRRLVRNIKLLIMF